MKMPVASLFTGALLSAALVLPALADSHGDARDDYADKALFIVTSDSLCQWRPYIPK